MTVRKLVVFEDGYKTRTSSAETIDFLSIKVGGVSGIEIKATSGNFDFSAKKLTNITSGSTTGDAVEYDQMNTALGTKINSSEKGAASGVAPLGSDSKISSIYLPSYVDDILEYANLAAFPATGETGKIYIALDTLKGYRWGGTVYAEVSPSDVNSVNGKTGIVTLNTDDIAESGTPTNKWFTDARAKAAAVADTISNGVLDVAPSQNAVYDALVNKSDILHDHAGTYEPANSNIQGHIGSTSNPHSVNKSQVGLSNVTNDAQVKKIASAVSDNFVAFDGVDGAMIKDSGKKASDFANASHSHTTSDITGFTAAVKAAAVADSITNDVTDVAPSQNAVYDALVLKQDVSEKYVSKTNDNAAAITIRQVVYVKDNGNVDLAINTIADLNKYPLALVYDASIDAAAAGNIRVGVGDIVGGFSGLLKNRRVYVSPTTAGGITQDEPAANHIYQVGHAISDSQVRFEPRHIIEVVS